MTGPATTCRFTASVNLGASVLVLEAGTAPGAAVQRYSGELQAGATPFSLKTMLAGLLDHFSLALPSSFPQLMIDRLSAEVTREPGDGPPYSRYRFEAASLTRVDRPFGATLPVSLEAFSIAFQSQRDEPILLDATAIATIDTIPALGRLKGRLLLRNRQYVLCVLIEGRLSLADVLEHLFNCTVPAGLADCLPSFQPVSAARPMRVYYASADMPAAPDPTGEAPVAYAAGYHLDDCLVTLLHCTFQIALDWVDADSYGFQGMAGALDFGYFRVVAPNPAQPGQGGPALTVRHTEAGTTIALAGTLVLNNLATISLRVQALNNPAGGTVFEGTITYLGTFFGTVNPELGIAWSADRGFRLTRLPSWAALDDLIDFASELQAISQTPRSGCKALATFVFEQAIVTTFSLDIGLGQGTGAARDGGGVEVSIGGSYAINVAGQKVCTITFDPLVLRVPVPGSLSDLGNLVPEALRDNAGALVRSLWDNKEAFFKLLLVQSVEEIYKSVIPDLICNAGGEQLGESVAGEAATQYSASTGGDMGTLAAAAGVFAAAGAVLAVLEKIIDCLTGKQRREQRDAERRQEAARQRIDELLTLHHLQCHYSWDDSFILHATWDAPNFNDPLAGLILAFRQPGLAFSLPLAPDLTGVALAMPLAAGASYTVTLTGTYNQNGELLTGPVLDAPSFTVAILDVGPVAVHYDGGANVLDVTWTAAPPFVVPPRVACTEYRLTLFDGATPVPGMSIVLPAPTPVSSGRISLLSPTFRPQPGVRYAVQVLAIANIPAFTSSPLNVSAALAVGQGIGHTLLGSTFELAPAQAGQAETI